MIKTTKSRKFLMVAAVGAFALTVAAGVLPALAKTTAHSVKQKQAAKITATRAEAVVLKKFPGKIVAKTKLENEEGKWQYGVMVQSGKTLREVMVGAYSGKIEDIEVTTAAKEGIEKD